LIVANPSADARRPPEAAVRMDLWTREGPAVSDATNAIVSNGISDRLSARLVFWPPESSMWFEPTSA
jgi:hypothetical protein